VKPLKNTSHQTSAEGHLRRFLPNVLPFLRLHPAALDCEADGKKASAFANFREAKNALHEKNFPDEFARRALEDATE